VPYFPNQMRGMRNRLVIMRLTARSRHKNQLYLLYYPIYHGDRVVNHKILVPWLLCSESDRVRSRQAPALMIERLFFRRIRDFCAATRHFVVHNVLHADDPPHRIALGVALGMFVAFTPTFGAQMVLVVFLAWLCRANHAIGLPLVWISNPATMVPIYWFCYKVGERLVGQGSITKQWWGELRHPPADWWPAMSFYWGRVWEIAGPLWVGSLIVAAVLGYVSYLVIYHVVRFYRLRRWGQLLPPDTFKCESPGRDAAV